MTTHHKLKAEWTRSSNEIFDKPLKEAKNNDRTVEKSGNKIKILDQIIIKSSCDTQNISNSHEPAINSQKSDNKKSKSIEASKSKKCQICEKSVILSSYEEHILSHDLFECLECGKKFKRKSSLRKHSYFHKGKFKYSCEDCADTFIDKSKFQIHCASKHNKIEKTYECKECSKQFTSPDYLKKHQATHSGNLVIIKCFY